MAPGPGVGGGGHDPSTVGLGGARPSFGRILVGFGLLFVMACSREPTGTEPPVPTTVQLSQQSLGFTALGDTVRLAATVLDQTGSALSSTPVSWMTSDEDVVRVSASGLVTATGNGTATVTAVAGSVEGRASAVVEQVPVRLRFTPDPVTLPEVADTVTIVATIVDANDFPMPTGPVVWTSDHPDTVEVSAAGVARAVAEGQTRISAVADGITGELAAFVGNAVVVIGSVGPSPWVDGAPGVIRGLGFDPQLAGNEVTLDGFPVTVTSASSVELQVTVPDADCSPPRQGRIRVAARGMVDSVRAPVRPSEIAALAPGEGMYTAEACLHLAPAEGEAEYVVGILSASETVSSLTPAVLAARTGSRAVLSTTAPTRQAAGSGTSSPTRFRAPEGAAVATAPRTPAAGASLDLQVRSADAVDRSGEARVRAAERAWLESLGSLAPSPWRGPAAAPRPAPVVNDTLTLSVPGSSCTDGTEVRARVRHVGQSAAFLEDVSNPAGGFTLAEYEAFDDFLTDVTLPVITDYFSDFADVDDNGVVLVLVTQEVNKREGLAGFVFSGDLASILGQSCSGANDAEIFYGLAPDPTGVANPEREISKNQLLNVYPTLIAHELTHILQFTARFVAVAGGGGGPLIKSSWELEGGATLAEQLVGYDVFGHVPRDNLGLDAWRLGADPDSPEANWYFDWVADMAAYFGFQGEDPPVAAAPEECSWIGRPEEGNDAPCESRRAVYGVPSTLLRWVLDRSGGTAFDDAELMRELTRSPYRGVESLTRATGSDRLDILVPFAVTLWADGRPELPANARDWLFSWDIHDIFSQINPSTNLRPHTYAGPTPELDVAVRAASSAYLEWTPLTDHDPTSLRIRATPEGGVLPAHMVLWVLRVR